jgi:hypothetical protein
VTLQTPERVGTTDPGRTGWRLFPFVARCPRVEQLHDHDNDS